ncbi:hypothetical protein ARMGADRAFT_1035021 [Armillaria gallica]|uniref:Uncharacterized protein n=1 Tax=Armillaria gallica TaxID=47427 RepID=A0A2H3CVR2_ARMGA|nr:hypothetical protein ARMGADRAFT_1035021 [Armillaria gallica]
MDVSLEDFKQTKKLQVNWVTHSNSGDPDGSEMASTIFDGNISNRRCLDRRMQEFQETISGDYTWVCTRMDGILGAATVRRERKALLYQISGPPVVDLKVPIWASAATLEVGKSVSTVSERIIVALSSTRHSDVHALMITQMNASETHRNAKKRIHAPRKRRILLAPSEVKRVGSQPAGSGGQRWARIGPTRELVGADISNSDGTLVSDR